MKNSYHLPILISALFTVPLLILRFVHYPVIEIQLLTGAVLVSALIYQTAFGKTAKPAYSRIHLLPVILFVLIISADLITGSLPQRVITLIFYFLVFVYFWLLFSLEPDGSRQAERIPEYTVYLTGIFAFFILSYFLFGCLAGSENSFTWAGLRNFTSEYTLALLIISIIVSVVTDKKSVRITAYFNAVFLAFLLFYLRTRTGWVAFLAFAITFSAYFLFNKSLLKGRMQRVLIISLFILAGFAAGAIFSGAESRRESAGDTALSLFDNEYHTNKARLIYWSASLKMFSDYPLTGIGGGLWFGMYPKYNGEEFNDGNVFFNAALNPHNDYAELLAEYGIIIFLVFAIFITAVINRLYGKSREKKEYSVFFLVFISLSVCALFSFTKDNPSAMIFLVSSSGIAFAVRKQNLFAEADSSSAKHKSAAIKIPYIRILLIAALTAVTIINVFRYACESRYFDALKMKAQKNYAETLNLLNGIPRELYSADHNRMPLDYYRGAVYFELKDYKNALACFRRAKILAPFYPSILSNEASACYMTGDKHNSYKYWDFIAAAFPDYIEPQVNYLSALTNDGDYEGGRKLMKKIIDTPKDTSKIKNYNVFLSIREFYDTEDM